MSIKDSDTHPGRLDSVQWAESTSSSAQSTPIRRLRKPTLQKRHYIVVTLVSCLVYATAINCGFVFDDVSAIRDNKDLRPETPTLQLFLNDFWGTPIHKEHSHKSYRPLTVLTFRLNYLLHGLRPAGYHLVNILLHAIVSNLLMFVTSELVSAWTAFITAILFAVHPIHTEAVAGVVGRAECLCAIFFLLSFHTYRLSKSSSIYLLPTILLVYIATLCKEQGLTVLGVCGVYEVFIHRSQRPQDIISALRTSLSSGLTSHLKSTLTRCSILAISGILFMYARIQVMGSELPSFTKFDNPAAAAAFPSRHLTFNYLLPVNFWLLAEPSHLCCDWTMGTIPLIESLADLRNLSTLVFYFSLLSAALYTCRSLNSYQYRVVTLSMSLLVFPFIPASNLLFPVGFVVAERILYLPSMGFSLLVAFGCEKLGGKSSYLLKSMLVFLITVHSLKTFQRNVDWSTELSLFKSGLTVNLKNAKLFNNIGHALETEQKFAEALKYFEKAVEVQPDDVGAHINVGRTLNNLKRYHDAEIAFLKAKTFLPRPRKGQNYQTRIAPNYLAVFLNLANLYARDSSRLEEADALYRQAISMRADYIQAYINRGDVLIKMNRTQEAWHVYERALSLDKSNPDIYYNMGVVLIELGKPAEALQYFEKALKVSPEHEQALMNSAILIQESGLTGLRQLAVERLNFLLRRGLDNERIWFNLAMLATDDKRYGDAERFFVLALRRSPDMRSALFNLALLMSDVGRPLDAKPLIERLLLKHPNHTKALTLLGDIYINHLKDTNRAKQCYERILQVDPGNIQAMHNLCVTHVNNGQLEVAERCLLDVQKRAPKESYVQQHLNVVKNRIIKLKKSSKPNKAEPNAT